MVPSNLKVFPKFGLCSNCSQKLDDCLLARARKFFCNCSHAWIFLSCSVTIIYILETKTDSGNNVSHMGKCGNIGDTSARH